MCQKLSDQDVQELRVETNCLLRKAKTPKSNITKEESKVLKELRGDQEKFVLTADKGVAIVVLDKKGFCGQRGRFIGTAGLQDHQHRPYKTS